MAAAAVFLPREVDREGMADSAREIGVAVNHASLIPAFSSDFPWRGYAKLCLNRAVVLCRLLCRLEIRRRVPRIFWLDLLRGLTCCLVWSGHSLEGKKALATKVVEELEDPVSQTPITNATNGYMILPAAVINSDLPAEYAHAD